jgi:DnaJ-class molecular chaperone
MRCEYCDGKGVTRVYYEFRENLLDKIDTCPRCDGVGAVIEEKIWVEKIGRTCGTCNGSGTIIEDYATERYPSGRPARYGKRKATCGHCKGHGKTFYGGYYTTTYRPDYKARKGGCFITTACIYSVPEADEFSALTLVRSFRDHFVASL